METGMTALLIVEDNATFAHTMIQFLNRLDGFTVAALASTAEDALAQLPQLAVDLALVDVSLPGTSGIELVAAIGQEHPHIRCIMLSGHHEYGYVRRALAAGAQGYVLKENPLDLIAAVEAVMAGETFLSAELRP
jgi:DNA-binding NarL/FixJ family response regulator